MSGGEPVNEEPRGVLSTLSDIYDYAGCAGAVQLKIHVTS
jgi:hypothetical protein